MALRDDILAVKNVRRPACLEHEVFHILDTCQRDGGARLAGDSLFSFLVGLELGDPPLQLGKFLLGLSDPLFERYSLLAPGLRGRASGPGGDSLCPHRK